MMHSAHKKWSSILSPLWLPKPPATKPAIEFLQAAVPFQLDNEYLDLLHWANGGEGQVGEVYLSIWPIEDVARLNEGYLIRQNLPKVLVVGDDSAHFYGFDYTQSYPEVIRFPIGFVHPSGINVREASLEKMLDGLATKRLY